jgi:large subunit ribosomal protein L30
MADYKKVRITLVKSPIGYKQNQKDLVHDLGLRKMNASRVLALTPQVEGMIFKVKHMLLVEEVTE